MLKAFKTRNTRRALRVTLVSEYLDDTTLAKYRGILDCMHLSDEIYISLFRTNHYPIVNVDEYFSYIDLVGIDLSRNTKERNESLLMLLEILEAKYGIEYVDPES